jgi:hypothetical protein
MTMLIEKMRSTYYHRCRERTITLLPSQRSPTSTTPRLDEHPTDMAPPEVVRNPRLAS